MNKNQHTQKVLHLCFLFVCFFCTESSSDALPPFGLDFFDYPVSAFKLEEKYYIPQQGI